MDRMDTVYGQPETSQLPRVLLALGHAGAIAAATWILFALPAGVHAPGITTVATPPDRRVMLFSAASIYFVRVLGTAFIFLRRSMGWGEALTILVWVAFAHIWFALLGRSSEEPLGILGIFSIALFLCGSYLNTGSEHARFKWKRRPENVGHLYTEGFFRLSRHINYFGDTMLFTGYALMTARLIALLIPMLMVFSFLFVNIPMLDRYLANRYGSKYHSWAARTKRFVPFLY